MNDHNEIDKKSTYEQKLQNILETSHESSDEEKKRNSSQLQFTSSDESTETVEDTDLDEEEFNKFITEINSEIPASADKTKISSYEENEISSQVKKFFQNSIETNKEYGVYPDSNDHLKFPNLTDLFVNSFKKNIENKLIPDVKKHKSLPSADTRVPIPGNTQNLDYIRAEKFYKECFDSSPSNNPHFEMVTAVAGNFVEKSVSEIIDRILNLLNFCTSDELNILNVIILKLVDFEPRLKEIKTTKPIILHINTIANYLKLLFVMFSKLSHYYDADQYKAIRTGYSKTQVPILSTTEENCNYTNNEIYWSFLQVLGDTSESLHCIMEAASSSLSEISAQIFSDDTCFPEHSVIHEETEDYSQPVPRSFDLPGNYKVTRNHNKAGDSTSSAIVASSDLHIASTSKQEFCKNTENLPYLNQKVDPAKVKKDHRFQKRFYKTNRELKECIGTGKENLNTSDCNELQVMSGSFSSSDIQEVLSSSSSSNISTFPSLPVTLKYDGTNASETSSLKERDQETGK